MSNPSGTSGGEVQGNGRRRTGTAPPRRASSAAGSATAATASRVAAADHATPGDPADTIDGESLTATTAANPTPKRPVEPVSSRLADARSVLSASTPAASSGAPVLAAVSTPSRRATSIRPGTPARADASAAFWASSMITRSR